jgi:hypothetical protein
MPFYMPSYSPRLSQLLDVRCFAVQKRAYGRLISDLARAGYNHIDILDVLADYPQACIEACQQHTIRNSFAAAGLVPFDPGRVLSKLNISFRAPTLPSSRPSSRSSQLTPKTPKTVVKLEKQSSRLINY